MIEKAISNGGDFEYKNYLDLSLGRTRDSLPQINSDVLDDLILHYQGNSKDAKVKKVTKKAKDLKPSQNEFDEDKILTMLRDYHLGKKDLDNKYVISKDNYLIDAQHRWATMLEIDEEKEVGCYQINLPIKELLRRTNLMKISRKIDINDVEIKKAVDDYTLSSLVEVFDEIEKGKKEKKHYSCAIIRNEEGKILFLKRHFNDDFHPNEYCLVGGGIDEGEKPEEAVKREIQEEIAKDTKHCHPIAIVNVKKDNCMIHYFEATLKGDNPMMLDREHSNYVFMNEEEWKEEGLMLELEDHLESILNLHYGDDNLAVFEKGRVGVYQNTSENRSKHRVGQRYSQKKVKEEKTLTYEPSTTLSEEHQKIEKKFGKYLNKKFTEAKNKYVSEFKNVLNTDNARELSKDYMNNKAELSSAVHEPSSAFIKKLYKEELAKKADKGKINSVYFTAGGTGAGKTSGLMGQEKIMHDKSQIVYDTNMSGFEGSVKKIEQALSSNKKIRINFTFRDPLEAFEFGAATRAVRIGRTVPLTEHIKTHLGSMDAIIKMEEKYKNDSRVTIIVTDNSRGKNNAKKSDINFVKGKKNDYVASELRKDLDAINEKLLKNGTITEKHYKGFKG